MAAREIRTWPAYLLNLARRPERLARFRQLQREEGWRLSEPVIVPAVDGDVVGPPTWWQSGGGAWGCLRSHTAALEAALLQNADGVVVLEDDVSWRADVWPVLDAFLDCVPTDWRCLMLGGAHVSPATRITDTVVRCTDTHRMHCYALRGEAIRDVYHLFLRADQHCDAVLAGWQRTNATYSPRPFLFGQGGHRSDICGKDEPVRFWN